MTPHNLPQKWQWVKLGDILDYEQPTQYIVKNTQYSDEYPTPVLTAGKSFILGYTNEREGIFEAPLPVIIFDDFTTSTKLVNFPFKVKSSAMKILKKSEKVSADIRFVFFMMQKLEINNDTHKRYWLNVVSHIKIPLPPLEIQREIVEILESKLEKIKEAKALLETSLQECETYRLSLLESAFSGNLTPHSQNWQNSTLGEIFDIERGGSPRPIQDYLTDNENGINWIKIGDVKKGEKYITSTKQKIKIEGLKKSRKIDIGDLLLTNSMSYGIPFISNIEGAIHDGWIVLKPKIPLSKEFVFYFLSSQKAYQYFDNKASGSTVRNLQINYVKDTPIPLPPLEIQREIVEILESKLEKIKEAKALLETSLQECETYRLSLLESAFAGELV